MARPQAAVGAPKVDPNVAARRADLELLRDQLKTAIADAGNRDLAPLAGQLRAVLNDLASLPAVTEASDVDDLAAQRARRRSAASAS